MAELKQAYQLPLVEGMETLPNPPDKNPRDILEQLIRRGMRHRGLEGKPEYEEQISYEKKVVQDKGLDVYFVIVWDIMREARKRGIATGFARGSAGGSLLCYVLQITEVDPLKYGLLFWRFLDPERNDTADIDLDFEDARRDEMKQYLSEKYGIENTGDIVTFNYFSAASAIKAACRVMDVPFSVSNTITKDFDLNSKVEDFKSARYKDFHLKYPGVYKLAKNLEGRLSGTGRHASAYVVSNEPLHEILPVESRKVAGEDFRAPAIAYDWTTAEAMGFVKIDLLSIKNLTVVSNAVRMIKENHGKILDYKNLPENDPAVLRMLSDGHTLGVFQAESPPSTSLIKRMKLDNFDDLVTSNALVRSGSWNAFGEEYLAVKKGHKKSHYPTEESKEFLTETYGFAIMQEQTMQMCSKVAGMTDAESNQVRRLTSKKKDKALLLPYKEKFVNGCVNNGVPKAEAEKLWTNIETTSEYQFNKCLRKDTKVVVRIVPELSDEFDGVTSVEQVYLWKKLHPNAKIYVKGPSFIKHGSAGGEEWYEVKDVYDNGVQEIVRVWINENWYIDSTLTHKHRMSKGWKEAARIHQLDRITTIQGNQTVWKKTWEGQDQTYDIELYDEKHAFYANDIITHNSHAVGYSLLSYAEAWLKYYYPAEFMCALLNNEKNVSSVAEYLAECNRLSIPVRTPDVNKSGLNYEVKDGVIYMGLSNVKFISTKLAERLIAMRNKKPFESFKDFCDRIMEKGSGLNSRVIDSLNKVGATKFWDHPIDEQACKQYYYEYLGIASIDSGRITPNMQRKITPMNEYEEKSTAIIAGVVKDIVQKNNWIRVDFQDNAGSVGFFVSEDHGFQKGKQYVVAIAKGNPVGFVDMESFNPNHPIIRYLNSEFKDDTWFIAAKARITKTGNESATILYSYKGKLDCCNVWSDLLSQARRFRPGQKIRIKVETSAKWGNTLKAIVLDTRESNE